jgi:hypothetical protein
MRQELNGQINVEVIHAAATSKGEHHSEGGESVKNAQRAP